jgi:outer membrane protein assembly factor BamB
MESNIKNTHTFLMIFVLISSIFIAIGGMQLSLAATIKPIAYVSVGPNIAGVGQTVVVNAFIVPEPDLNWLYSNIYVDITTPAGTLITKGPLYSDPAGALWFIYTPDSVGTYSIVLRWAGGNNTVDYNNQPKPPKVSYEAITSQSFNFIVQKDALPGWPTSPLPTGYWERPISDDYPEWAQIAGDWLYPTSWGDTWRPKEQCNNQVNPYSQGPESSHVAWVKKQYPGGLVGDASGTITNPDFPNMPVIIGGVGYYQKSGLHAVDIRTGEELWVNTAMTENPNFGKQATLTFAPNVGSSINPPSIWTISDSAIKQYNAQTGNLINNYPSTNRSNTIFAIDINQPNGGVLLYLISRNSSAARSGSLLQCWNSSAPGTTFASKVVFTVQGTQVETRPFPYLYNDVIVTAFHGQYPLTNMSAFDSKTGRSLWNVTLDYTQEGDFAVGYDKLFETASTDRRMHAYDIYTGQEVWQSEQADYPWGAFWAYSIAVAYGKVYAESYDGHMYAFDAQTGKTVWKFYTGNTTLTPYNTWPVYGRSVVADGKVYFGSTEHSPVPPYYQGRQLYAVDANTGSLLWSISGQYDEKALADGVLVGVDSYTGQMFAFGKGKTETTVSATKTQISKGEWIGITGTVIDLSPAQPGTPAVSKESMTAWMEHLHMNRPVPTNTTGVPVKLIAIGSDGTTIDIGSATSDADGHFSLKWTPTKEDLYKITATFEGDESYWSSSAFTDIAVGSAAVSPITTSTPQPTNIPTSTPTQTGVPTASPSVVVEPGTGLSTETLLIAGAAVVITIAVIAAALVLRKRK